MIQTVGNMYYLIYGCTNYKLDSDGYQKYLPPKISTTVQI